jgi:hypothetical protein
MGHDWNIDVLADMRTFANQNEMPLLCAQLDDAMLVAAAEVAARPRYATPWPADDRAQSGAIGKD